MPSLRRALLAAPLSLPAFAQTTLPPTTITADRDRLTVESNEAARIRLWSSPGANTLVPAAEFQQRPGATTVRDIFEFTPGIFAQPKWGEDARFSIRGSGLARNFHLRGVLVMQDGIPFNQADGSGDLQEIDPLAYQRVEVFRGGNAFAFNNATLGGAVNFITNTGASAPGGTARVEAGTEAWLRSQMAYGAARGPWDGYASATFSRADGYRQNSAQLNTRLNANAAYRWAENLETRIIAGYNNIWQQIPGAVTLRTALDRPRTANATNLALRYQRNIESFRLGTITTWQATPELRLEAGGSFVDRQLDHPIFQFVDNHTRDVHLFARGVWDGQLGGLRNRLAFGVNFAQGTIDNLRFVNAAGLRGARTFSSLDYARNITAFAENALYVLPNIAVVAGIQGGQAQRESRNRLNPALSGAGEWAWANPRFGLLWQVTADVQAYANATWSTEPPTL
jgi:iron complex outermembrane receptor protein